MRWIRHLFLLTTLLSLGALVWAGIYTRKQGFTQSWRGAIEREFADRGYHVEIGKVTLGAFRGLVAENVTFFENESRREGVAVLDRVSLDVDLSRIFQKRIAVNSFDVEEASLSLPLDPALPHGRRLVVEGISGRVVFTESMIEVLRAEASMGGVDLEFKGSLTRSPEEADTRRRGSGARTPQGETLAEFRQFATRLLDELDAFEFHGARPSLRVSFRGGTDDISTTSLTVELETAGIGRRGAAYRIESLFAKGHYLGTERQFRLEVLEAKDAGGDLRLSGSWEPDGESLGFEVVSGIDLAGLAGWFHEDRRWREAVFFAPPKIRAEGHVLLEALREQGGGFPGEILGEFQAGRFVTRGVVFEGLDFGFRATGERVYLRNARLGHRSGVAFLNLKHEPGQGAETLRYQTEIKLDPGIFQPFLGEEARRFLGAWTFAETSTVYLAAAGSGDSWAASSWTNRGVVQLRNFWLNGVEFAEMNAEFESGADEAWLREIALEHGEGSIGAELARYDPSEKRWEVRGGFSRADPGRAARAFHPGLDAQLGGVRFSEAPLVRFAGEIDARPKTEVGPEIRHHRLELAFETEAPAVYPVPGRELRVERSRGVLVIDGSRLHLREFQGEAGDGTIALDHETEDLRLPGPPFRLEARFDRFPADALAAREPAKPAASPPRGNERGGGETSARAPHPPLSDLLLSGDLRLEGQSAEPAAWTGEGRVEISGASLVSHPVAEGLLRDQGQEEGTLPPEYGDEGAASPPPSLSAAFRLRDGTLHLDRLTGRSGALRLAGAGQVELGHEGGFTAEAALAPGDAAIPPGGEDRAPGLRGYAASGTLSAPSWQPLALSAFQQLAETEIPAMLRLEENPGAEAAATDAETAEEGRIDSATPAEPDP